MAVKTVKKLFSFTHSAVAERLSSEPNQSSLVEQLVAAHYGIELPEEKLEEAGRTALKLKIATGEDARKIHASVDPSLNEIPIPVVDAEKGYEEWPVGTQICGFCGKPFIGETCLCQL